MLVRAKELMEDEGHRRRRAPRRAHVVGDARAALELRGAYPGRCARSLCRSRRRGPTRGSRAAATRQAQLSHALGLSLWLTGLRGRVSLRAHVDDPGLAGRALRRLRAALHERRDRHARGRLGAPRLRRQQARAGAAGDRLGGPLLVRPAARARLALPPGGDQAALPVLPGDGALQLRRAAERARRPRARQATCATGRPASSGRGPSRSSTRRTAARRRGSSRRSGADPVGHDRKRADDELADAAPDRATPACWGAWLGASVEVPDLLRRAKKVASRRRRAPRSVSSNHSAQRRVRLSSRRPWRTPSPRPARTRSTRSPLRAAAEERGVPDAGCP